MFGSIGPMELLLIFIIVLVVFGADRLPELARGLGKGMREFRRAADEVKREIMFDPNLKIDLDESLPKPDSGQTDPYQTEEDWTTADAPDAPAITAASEPPTPASDPSPPETGDEQNDPETPGDEKNDDKTHLAG